MSSVVEYKTVSRKAYVNGKENNVVCPFHQTRETEIKMDMAGNFYPFQNCGCKVSLRLDHRRDEILLMFIRGNKDDGLKQKE
jgi:hypothetical protein